MYKISECPKCKGKGYIVMKEYNFFNLNDFRYVREKCNKCNGTGLIRELIKP